MEPVYDHDLYRTLSPKQRLLMNKLYLAEQLGYVCGPTGENHVQPGTYCIRPIMNLRGNGAGGWTKHEVNEQELNVPNKPGYFYSEWFEGDQQWTEFVNGVPQYAYVMRTGVNGWCYFEATEDYPELPDFLRGYETLLVETIGKKIIEVSFRLIPNADPIRKAQYPDGSWYWETDDEQ